MRQKEGPLRTKPRKLNLNITLPQAKKSQLRWDFYPINRFCIAVFRYAKEVIFHDQQTPEELEEKSRETGSVGSLRFTPKPCWVTSNWWVDWWQTLYMWLDGYSITNPHCYCKFAQQVFVSLFIFPCINIGHNEVPWKWITISNFRMPFWDITT